MRGFPLLLAPLLALGCWPAPENPGHALDVAAANGFVYVAGSTGFDRYGLQVVDVRDVARPTALGAVETVGAPEAVAVANGLAYLVGMDDGLRIVDVRNPAAPTTVFTERFYDPPRAHSVAVDGDRAFVAARSLFILDVSDPAYTRVLRELTYNSALAAWTVAASNDLLYAAMVEPDGFRRELHIIDVADAASPRLLSVVSLGTTPLDMVVVRDHLIVADTGELTIYDVSNPTLPFVVARDNRNARGLDERGDILYVATDAGLNVFDVSVPASPELIGDVDTPGDPRDVVIMDEVAYVAAETSLERVNVTNPASPRLLFGPVAHRH